MRLPLLAPPRPHLRQVQRPVRPPLRELCQNSFNHLRGFGTFKVPHTCTNIGLRITKYFEEHPSPQNLRPQGKETGFPCLCEELTFRGRRYSSKPVSHQSPPGLAARAAHPAPLDCGQGGRGGPGPVAGTRAVPPGSRTPALHFCHPLCHGVSARIQSRTGSAERDGGTLQGRAGQWLQDPSPRPSCSSPAGTQNCSDHFQISCKVQSRAAWSPPPPTVPWPAPCHTGLPGQGAPATAGPPSASQPCP